MLLGPLKRRTFLSDGHLAYLCADIIKKSYAYSARSEHPADPSKVSEHSAGRFYNIGTKLTLATKTVDRVLKRVAFFARGNLRWIMVSIDEWGIFVSESSCSGKN